MNVIINVLVLFLFNRVSAIQLLKKHDDFATVDKESEWISEHGGYHEGNGSRMNSTMYMSVNNYYCAAEDIEDAGTILYGTKSWTFPKQDVNLTLSYPSVNLESDFSSEEEGYIITAFKVVIYIDAMETNGYITNGGVLQDSISLTFVSWNITSLSYQFWLYGKPKQPPGANLYDVNANYFVCK